MGDGGGVSLELVQAGRSSAAGRHQTLESPAALLGREEDGHHRVEGAGDSCRGGGGRGRSGQSPGQVRSGAGRPPSSGRRPEFLPGMRGGAGQQPGQVRSAARAGQVRGRTAKIEWKSPGTGEGSVVKLGTGRSPEYGGCTRDTWLKDGVKSQE